MLSERISSQCKMRSIVRSGFDHQLSRSRKWFHRWRCKGRSWVFRLWLEVELTTHHSFAHFKFHIVSAQYQRIRTGQTSSHAELQRFKVHIFWEGHKTLQNLHRRFVLCSNSQICGGDFLKLCGLLKMYLYEL